MYYGGNQRIVSNRHMVADIDLTDVDDGEVVVAGVVLILWLCNLLRSFVIGCVVHQFGGVQSGLYGLYGAVGVVIEVVDAHGAVAAAGFGALGEIV